MSAVVLLLVLGADPEPSEHVKNYLDSCEFFKTRQIRRTKEAIVWIENKLAKDKKYTPKQLGQWKPSLAQLRKTLKALEAAERVPPQLHLPYSNLDGKFPVGYVGAIPKPYNEFDASRGEPQMYHFEYSFSATTEKGSRIDMIRICKERPDGAENSSGSAAIHLPDMPDGLVKGERVDKLVAGKVYRIVEIIGQSQYVLEPFDMAEVDAFLKEKK